MTVITANPGRYVRIEGRVTVEPGARQDAHIPADPWREHRLLVDGEPLDELIWRSMHVDPDDEVFGRLVVKVEAA